MSATIFCHTITPPLKLGDKFKRVFMNQGLDSFDGFIELTPEDGFQGLFTVGMNHCITLACVKRSDKGEITSLAMCHFYGGITSENLKGFIEKIQGDAYELELVVCGGALPYSLRDDAYKTNLVKKLNQVGLGNYDGLFNQINFLTNESLCVTFTGYIGGFTLANPLPYARTTKTKTIQAEDLSLPYEIARFDKLIETLKVQDSKIQNLEMIKGFIEEERAHYAPALADIYRATSQFLIDLEFGDLSTSEAFDKLESALSRIKHFKLQTIKPVKEERPSHSLARSLSQLFGKCCKKPSELLSKLKENLGPANGLAY